MKMLAGIALVLAGVQGGWWELVAAGACVLATLD